MRRRLHAVLHVYDRPLESVFDRQTPFWNDGWRRSLTQTDALSVVLWTMSLEVQAAEELLAHLG